MAYTNTRDKSSVLISFTIPNVSRGVFNIESLYTLGQQNGFQNYLGNMVIRNYSYGEHSYYKIYIFMSGLFVLRGDAFAPPSGKLIGFVKYPVINTPRKIGYIDNKITYIPQSASYDRNIYMELDIHPITELDDLTNFR